MTGNRPVGLCKRRANKETGSLVSILTRAARVARSNTKRSEISRVKKQKLKCRLTETYVYAQRLSKQLIYRCSKEPKKRRVEAKETERSRAQNKRIPQARWTSIGRAAGSTIVGHRKWNPAIKENRDNNPVKCLGKRDSAALNEAEVFQKIVFCTQSAQ